MELQEHETYSDYFLYLLQQFSTSIYSDIVFSDHFTTSDIIDYVSQKNYFIKSLFTNLKSLFNL